MFEIMALVNIVTGAIRSIREKLEPKAPPIYNFELYQKDILNGCSPKQLYKYQLNGRYRKPDNIVKPHRNSNGQIVLEDMEKYRADTEKYGVVQAQKWAREGRYNK